MRWNILIHLLIILDLNTWFMSYFKKIFKYFHVFYNCLKIIFRVMSIWNSKWQSIRLSWKFDPLLWRFYQNNCLVITFNQRERKKEMNEWMNYLWFTTLIFYIIEYLKAMLLKWWLFQKDLIILFCLFSQPFWIFI